MRNVAYLVAIVAVIACASWLAFDPARAGSRAFYLCFAVPTLALAIAGVLRARNDGVLAGWLAIRSGDITRGVTAGAVLFGGAFAFMKLVAPPESPRSAWFARFYLQLGEPGVLRKEVFAIVLAMVVLAVAEEILWRGLVVSLLSELVGSRRAWIWQAVLYALAHLPTVWMLRDTDVGPNPLVLLAAFGSGLVWGAMARRFERLLPNVISHVLVYWIVLMMFRLWGAERLKLASRTALLFVLAACHEAPAADARKTRATTAPHLQIVRAMTTPERKALVERFRARNPGAAWLFNEDALEESAVVIDPFRGFLRRGRSARVPGAGRAAMPEDAARAARGFVERNADLLGIPAAVVHALAEERSAAGGHWSIRFDATYPTKGYETLRELDNQIDLDVLVADDGAVIAFQNRSRIHPPLHIELKPRLAPDDATLVREIVGRQVFAVVETPGQDDPRALPRLALGAIRLEDVQHVALTVWSSPGPAQAYLSYRLAYAVDVTRGVRAGFMDPFFKPVGYAFRYIVDADTGQVVEDARAPVMPLPEEQ